MGLFYLPKTILFDPYSLIEKVYYSIANQINYLIVGEVINLDELGLDMFLFAQLN